MRTFYINNQLYNVLLKDENYYMFIGLKDLLKKNIIKENEMINCLKIYNQDNNISNQDNNINNIINKQNNIIYELENSNLKILTNKQSILKEIISFYNHKHQSGLNKMIKLLKKIISFDVQGFETIENLYIKNNKNITIYNYFFDFSKYKHHKYEEYKIICLLYEYLEKIDINTLLFTLGYFCVFYKSI